MSSPFKPVCIINSVDYLGEPGTGSLSIIEAKQVLPFSVDRFFFVTGMVRKARRGGHANKIVNEAICCLSGSLSIHTLAGELAQSHVLSTSTEFLLIASGTWVEIEAIEEHTSYCVLADHTYIEAAPNYIRTMDEYRAYVVEALCPAADV